MKGGYWLLIALGIGNWATSTAVFGWAVTSKNWMLGMGMVGLVSAIWAWTFVTVFEHEQDWPGLLKWERKERKMEKKWVNRLAHLGKLGTTIGIDIILGPLFGAFTAMLLIRNKPYKMGLIIASTVAGAWGTLIAAWGGWQWLVR